MNHNIDKVLAIDISKDNIESTQQSMGIGAKERYRLLKKQNSSITDVDFLVGDTSKDLYDFDGIYLPEYNSQKSAFIRKYPKQSFDMAVSFFSIHYYFESQEKLVTFFTNARNTLRQGGLLLITCMDGELVARDLKKTNPIHYNYSDKGTLKKLWSIRKGIELDIESFDDYKNAEEIG